MGDRYHIVIVEDDPKEQERYHHELLQGMGETTEVTFFSNGKKTLNYLYEQEVDCILLAETLPDMGGLELVKSIREIMDSIVPVILLCETSDNALEKKCFELGVYDYVEKEHVCATLLNKMINNAIERFRLVQLVETKEDEIRYHARFDSLTGIPNRIQFAEIALRSLQLAQRHNYSISIILVDIDEFKEVNRRYGYQAGDLLLKQITKRLKQCMRGTDILARMGDNEFVYLVEHLDDASDSAIVAKKIFGFFSQPFFVQSHKIHLRVSIGVSIYPDSGEDMLTLMRKADIALSQSKAAGGGTLRIYTDQLEMHSKRKKKSEHALRYALTKKEFYMEYQPIIDLDTGQVYAIEALLRCQSEDLLEATTSEIIHVAEDSGLIIPLGDWVINEVFKQYSVWCKAYPITFKISINLSPVQVRDINWLSKIKIMRRQYQVDPKQIIFELTETDVFTDLERTGQQLRELTDMGCLVFIDDFGTGYSSINLIRTLPIAGLKIDQSFICDVMTDPNNAVLVQSIMSMAGSLGLIVVSEGIEDQDQFEFIKSQGNQKGQGYYLEKPMSHESVFEKILQSKKD